MPTKKSAVKGKKQKEIKQKGKKQRKPNPSSNNASKSNASKSIGKKIKRGVFWTFLVIFLVLSLMLLTVVLIFNFKYGKTFKQLEDDAKKLVWESNEDTFRQMETSLVYDVNGDLISVLKGEKDVYYLDIENIPEYVINAMISIEDKKFLSHGGVDVKANIRAMIALLKNKGTITQGASTITQQLARNIFLSNEVTWERKFREIFIAIELEKKYSKSQIMEFYLNNIYFANGFYGIQAASKGYFSKNVDELSLSQLVFLCAIPNNPTTYDPMENPDNTKERRDRILTQMYEDGSIGIEEFHAAQNEEIEIVQVKVGKNNYVETFVFYCAARALMEQQGFEFRNQFKNNEDREEYELEYTEAYNRCQKSLYYEGYRIYTSIDPKKQQLLQESIDTTLKDYTKKNKEGIYSLQGAAVSIENKTGKVVAIIGGRYQERNGYTLNRAYQSYRQPGSAIKPLIIYAPLFEKGYYPDDIMEDKAIKDGPTNASGVYYGKMKIRRAVELSSNTIAWQLFQELTPKVGLSYLLEMNFAKINSNDYYPAASLGGFTKGVSPLEMTAAFATLENDGIYRKPTCIISILDAQGKVIVDEDETKKRIYEKNAARIMTDILKGVVENGTGRGMRLENMTSAGKTGTTSDKKDGWFVGYTPYYTTGVWVGYDMPKKMQELSGASFPGTIWKNYMNQIHKGLKSKEFAGFKDRVKEEPTPKPQETIPKVRKKPIITEENISNEEQLSPSGVEDGWEVNDDGQEIDWEDFENQQPEFEDFDQDYDYPLEELPSDIDSTIPDTETYEELPDEDIWTGKDPWNN